MVSIKMMCLIECCSAWFADDTLHTCGALTSSVQLTTYEASNGVVPAPSAAAPVTTGSAHACAAASKEPLKIKRLPASASPNGQRTAPSSRCPYASWNPQLLSASPHKGFPVSETRLCRSAGLPDGTSLSTDVVPFCKQFSSDCHFCLAFLSLHDSRNACS